MNLLKKTTLIVFNFFFKCIPLYIFGMLVLVMVLLPMFLPFLLFRRFVFYIGAPYMRPDLGKMLNAVGCIAASGKSYKSPATKLNIALIVEGIPSEESAREAVESAISSIDPKSGKFLYPEMKQFVEYFLGYPFFKDEEEFKLNEHFKFIENSQSSPISSDDLEHILKTSCILGYI
jgi:hypothetical protein